MYYLSFLCNYFYSFFVKYLSIIIVLENILEPPYLYDVKNYGLLHRNSKWNSYKKEIQKLCCIVCAIFYLLFIITFEYVSFYLGYMVVNERNTTFVNSLAKNSEALNSSKNKRIKYSGNNALVYRTPNASECHLTNYLSPSEIIAPCL